LRVDSNAEAALLPERERERNASQRDGDGSMLVREMTCEEERCERESEENEVGMRERLWACADAEDAGGEVCLETA
jgi:hypothetical protein